MTLTSERAEEIKKQLIEQVDKLPNENKDQIKEHIESLDEEGLEEFLKQNNIRTANSNQQEKPVFESILNNEIPSYKIAENSKAIAILEINPLSKGHCLIIPKQKTTIEKIPKTAFSLAQKISKRLKTKLKPEEIKIETFSFQNYPAINVIPIYKEPLKKQKADEEDLINIQNKLITEKNDKKTKKTKTEKKLPEISFRIPY